MYGMHKLVCYNYLFTIFLFTLNLTGAMAVALGRGAAGTFSTSNDLWAQLYEVRYCNYV